MRPEYSQYNSAKKVEDVTLEDPYHMYTQTRLQHPVVLVIR